MNCANCGKEIAENTQFCPNCGVKVVKVQPPAETKRYCPSCGKEVTQGTNFCANCGAMIPKIAVQAEVKKICAGCGKELTPGIAFCPNCGTPAARDPVLQTVAAPPQYVAPSVPIAPVPPVPVAPAYAAPVPPQPAPAASAPVTQPVPAAKPAQAFVVDKSSTGISPKFGAALCYLFIPVTGFLFVLIEKQSKFLKFHAWQSLIFAVEMIILWIAVIVGAMFVSLIGYAQYLVSLFGFIMWIVVMVTSLQGKVFKIPIAGQIASSLVK